MANPSASAGPGRTMLMAGGLFAASVLAFLVGATMLGIGLTMHSSPANDHGTAASGDGHPADPSADSLPSSEAHSSAPEGAKSGGFFSGLKRIVSKAVPSSGGPAKPGFEDGHPVGLYLMTRYWSSTGSLEKAVWYFTPDGRVYENPEDGFSDERLARNQGHHGTVSAKGDTLVMAWSDGKESSGPLEREKDGFNWDMGIFTPVEGFADDSRLVGRWEGGASLTMSGGGHAATSATLDLRPDGTFGREAASSIGAKDSEGSVSAGSQGTSAGKWRLDGYTLELTYNDGKVVRGITFPFDDEKIRRFYFAGTMYKKL